MKFWSSESLSLDGLKKLKLGLEEEKKVVFLKSEFFSQNCGSQNQFYQEEILI